MVDEISDEKQTLQQRIERYQKDIRVLVNKVTLNTLSSLKHSVKQATVASQTDKKKNFTPNSSSEFSRDSNLEEERSNLVPEDE